MGVERPSASTLQPKWLPVHGKSQHLQRRLEWSIGSLALPLTNDAIAGRDALASCLNIPAARRCATSTWLVDDLQVEDDATPLDLPRLDPAVEDSDGLGKGGDVWARGEATWAGEGGRHGV